MEKRELKVGDIVQIDPAHYPVFGASLMIVTDPKSWGAQGYVHVLGDSNAVTTFKGVAFYRCAFENMELVGHAAWVRSVEEEA